MGHMVLPDSFCCSRFMRTGEAAAYLNMSVVGVRKAASEGRLPSRRIGSGQRMFDRTDLDAYLGRPPAPDKAPADRVEAWYCRVSGSTGQESSLAHSGVDVARERFRGRVPGVQGSRFWCEGNAGRCGPDARRRRQRTLHGGAGGVAGSVGPVRSRLNRKVFVGGRGYGRGPAGVGRHVAGGGVDG
jgi:excisionase family DNA binding protein